MSHIIQQDKMIYNNLEFSKLHNSIAIVSKNYLRLQTTFMLIF